MSTILTLKKLTNSEIINFLQTERNLAFQVWTIHDVLGYAKDQKISMTEDEAKKIIADINRDQCANSGINWETIDSLFEKFKESKRPYINKKNRAAIELFIKEGNRDFHGSKIKALERLTQLKGETISSEEENGKYKGVKVLEYKENHYILVKLSHCNDNYYPYKVETTHFTDIKT